MSHPLGVPDAPPPMYTACPFCNENATKLGDPTVCGKCMTLIWYVSVGKGRRDWCDIAGHTKVQRKNEGRVVATGHRTEMLPHTNERCREAQARGIRA